MANYNLPEELHQINEQFFIFIVYIFFNMEITYNRDEYVDYDDY